jgi:hypothetical protein
LLAVKYPTETNALSETRTAIPRFMFLLAPSKGLSSYVRDSAVHCL